MNEEHKETYERHERETMLFSIMYYTGAVWFVACSIGLGYGFIQMVEAIAYSLAS